MADKDEVEPTTSDAEASADAVPEELRQDDLVPDDDADRHDELESAPAQREPATVGAGAGAANAGSRRPAPTPKGTPTSRRDAEPERERTTPARFVRQSVGELRKVVYPTGQQLMNYFVVVLVFVLFIIAFVSLLDLGLGWAIFKVFS